MDSKQFFDYFMKLLKSSMEKKNKQSLMILQTWRRTTPASGLKGASRRSPRRSEIRNRNACESYQGHVVPAFLMWIDDGGHKLPAWVSKELMRQSTLNGEYNNKQVFAQPVFGIYS